MTDGSMTHGTSGMGGAGPDYNTTHMLADYKPKEGGILISLRPKGCDNIALDPDSASGPVIGEGQTSLPQGQARADIQTTDVDSRPLKPSAPSRNFDPFQSLFEGTFLPRASGENEIPERYHGHIANEPLSYIKEEEEEETFSMPTFQQDEDYTHLGHYNNYREDEPEDIQAHYLWQRHGAQEGTRHNQNHIRHKKRLNPEKTALIEERIKRERPNRTLFVRNLGYNADLEDVRALYAPFGEIKSMYSLIEKRGLAFITYFDIRAAEFAKRETHGMELDGRELDVHYSLPREGQYSKDCGKDNNNGTMFVYLKCSRSTTLTDQDVEDFFSVFGEIKLVKKNPHTPSGPLRFVEFFDSRACARAVSEGKGQRLLGGVLDCKFAWDQPRGYPPIHTKGSDHPGRDERQKSRSDLPSRTPSPQRSLRYNPDENAYEATLRQRRRSSDFNREKTTGRRDSYGSSYRLDRSESRDRGSHHGRHYREHSPGNSCIRQETNYNRRTKQDSSYNIPIKREDSHDTRINREDPYATYSRPSDRDVDRGNTKEWGRTTFHNRSRSRGRSEIRDRVLDGNHASFGGDHFGSSNGQPQSVSRHFDEQRQSSLVPNFGPRPPETPPFGMAATSQADRASPPVSIRERLEQAQKAQMLINTVLQTSGNAVPLRNALATKAGDRASLEPRRASTPGIHPATALRGEYSDANGNPSVRPQQTAGVPSSMPHLLSVPAKHSHPEPQVQIQPQQRLLHNHPEFKAPNEVAASRPLESPVQSPMTHSVLSQNPSTEDQVQQLLQLLTQVQQQSRASVNGSTTSMPNANASGPDLMSLMPHLSQLSTLVQQSLRMPNQQQEQQQQQHPPQSLQPAFQPPRGQQMSTLVPMLQKQVDPLDSQFTRGAGVHSMMTPPPPPGPRPVMPTQLYGNTISACNPTSGLGLFRTPLPPQTDTVLSALPMSDIQRSYIQRKNNGEISNLNPNTDRVQIGFEKKVRAGSLVPQTPSKPIESSGLYIDGQSKDFQGMSDRSKDYRKLDENFENQYRNRTHSKVESWPRSDSKKRRLDDDEDAEYSERKRSYRERSSIRDDRDYEKGSQTGSSRSKNFIKNDLHEEMSASQSYGTNYNNNNNDSYYRHGDVNLAKEQGRAFQREGSMPSVRGRGRGRGSHRGEFGDGGRGRGRGRGRGGFHANNGQLHRYENDDQNRIGATFSIPRPTSGGGIDRQNSGVYHDQNQGYDQKEDNEPSGWNGSIRGSYNKGRGGYRGRGRGQ